MSTAGFAAGEPALLGGGEIEHHLPDQSGRKRCSSLSRPSLSRMMRSIERPDRPSSRLPVHAPLSSDHAARRHFKEAFQRRILRQIDTGGP